MIQIFCTECKYIISLPFNGDLALDIVPECKWDQHRNAWVCPRNAQTRDILIEIFEQVEVSWIEYDHILGMTKPCMDSGAKGMPIFDPFIQRIMAEDALQSLSELFVVAKQYGFPEDAAYDDLVAFTKAAYEGNQRFAEMVARVATLEAQIRSNGHKNSD